MGLGLPLGQACLLPSGCWALWETLVKWEQAGWPGAESLGDQQPRRVLQRMRAGEISMSAVAWPQRPAVWVQIQLRGPWKPQRGVMGWNCIQETLALCSQNHGLGQWVEGGPGGSCSGALLFQRTWFEEHPTCSARSGSSLAAPLLSSQGMLLGNGSADITVSTLCWEESQREESVSVRGRRG